MHNKSFLPFITISLPSTNKLGDCLGKRGFWVGRAKKREILQVQKSLRRKNYIFENIGENKDFFT